MNLTPEELEFLYQLLQKTPEATYATLSWDAKKRNQLLQKFETTFGKEKDTTPFSESVLLYTDGASRGNPGAAGYGFLMTDLDGKEVYSDCGYLGEATNNVAEYEALYEGLKACLQHQVKQVRIYSDSELMVKQLRGQYRVKNPNLVPIFQRIQQQLKSLSWSIQHIPREHNQKADALANEGINKNF